MIKCAAIVRLSSLHTITHPHTTLILNNHTVLYVQSISIYHYYVFSLSFSVLIAFYIFTSDSVQGRVILSAKSLHLFISVFSVQCSVYAMFVLFLGMNFFLCYFYTFSMSECVPTSLLKLLHLSKALV